MFFILVYKHYSLRMENPPKECRFDNEISTKEAACATMEVLERVDPYE